MIEELTPEQVARFEEFRDKWIKIGLATGSVDWEEAKQAATDAYKVAGLEPPKYFMRMPSPLAGVICLAVLNKAFGSDPKPNRGSKVNVKNYDMKATLKLVGERVKELGLNADKALEDFVLYDSDLQIDTCGFGAHDSGWLSFYDFFLEVVKLDCCKQLEPLMTLAKHCGWWIPLRDVAILQDRPSVIQLDERGRLHCPTGPALAYTDGFAVYAVHGVRVPKDIVEDPKSITAERIEKESNAEIRRVMIELFGLERFLEEGGLKEVQRDDFGVLYEKQYQGDIPIKMVKVKNTTPEPDGSHKTYVIPCASSAQTAHEAVASSFGMQVKEYHPEQES